MQREDIKTDRAREWRLEPAGEGGHARRLHGRVWIGVSVQEDCVHGRAQGSGGSRELAEQQEGGCRSGPPCTGPPWTDAPAASQGSQNLQTVKAARHTGAKQDTKGTRGGGGQQLFPLWSHVSPRFPVRPMEGTEAVPKVTEIGLLINLRRWEPQPDFI